MLAARFKTFGADFDLLFDGRRFLVLRVERHNVEATIGKMAVRTKDAGNFSFRTLRAIQISGDEVARIAFEINFFDRVAFAVDGTIDDGV